MYDPYRPDSLRLTPEQVAAAAKAPRRRKPPSQHKPRRVFTGNFVPAIPLEWANTAGCLRQNLTRGSCYLASSRSQEKYHHIATERPLSWVRCEGAGETGSFASLGGSRPDSGRVETRLQPHCDNQNGLRPAQQ